MDYIFWSAKEVLDGDGDADDSAAEAKPAAAPEPRALRARSRVLGRDELLAALETRAAEAAMAAGGEDPRIGPSPRRVCVGFVGYPNVGKSSTLNALIGEKKASVGPTPGKTKHFQTFNMSETLMLADCPGLASAQTHPHF